MRNLLALKNSGKMHYQINFHEDVKGDLKKIGQPWLSRIMIAIHKKLSTEPEIFGIPLRKSLRNYRKLRIGDYRVIFKIKVNTVEVFAIGHRSTVYKDLLR